MTRAGSRPKVFAANAGVTLIGQACTVAEPRSSALKGSKEEEIMTDIRSRFTGALARALVTTVASGLLGLMLVSLPAAPAAAEPMDAAGMLYQANGGIEVGAQRGERGGDRGGRDFGRAGRNNVIVRPGGGGDRVIVRPGGGGNRVVVRPARNVVVLPGYRVRPWWRRGGAIAAGVALGVIAAGAAAAWAGPPPGPEYCWYYTDPSQRQGFWDYCQ
jgi:hypothetical protein